VAPAGVGRWPLLRPSVVPGRLRLVGPAPVGGRGHRLRRGHRMARGRRRRGRCGLRPAATVASDVGRGLDRQDRGRRHLDGDAPGHPGRLGRPRAGHHGHGGPQPRADPTRHRAAGRAAAGGSHPRDALLQFAESVADPCADRVVCSLLLAFTSRAQRLGDLLQALAESTREEVSLRLRIETSRASVRSGVRTVVVFSVVFAAGLAVLARSYLAPFGSAEVRSSSSR